MATATETLQATLSETEYAALRVLADSTAPLSGRKVALGLRVSPTTANGALATLSDAGFATARISGRATLWQLAVSNPSISAWLAEITVPPQAQQLGASPYATGGGGVRLEHSYAACLVSGLLAGESLVELGDAASVHSIRLQASDVSDVDDILIEGRDAQAQVVRASVAVRRSPLLTSSDAPSVPLIADFLSVVTEHWLEALSGRWRLVLAVSSNANAIGQLSELAELARSLPDAATLANRLAQPGRTNNDLRKRYGHIEKLVELASKDLPSAHGLDTAELTWRLLSSLSTRSLRLERTDRADRTAAVNRLQRMLDNGTPAAADAVFSRIEELVGEWAPQGAVLTQSVIRRRLSQYPLSRSQSYAAAWTALDRLGVRLRESIRPGLQSGGRSLELDRTAARTQLIDIMRSIGNSAGAVVVTGEPDVGKSALSLRAAEALPETEATVLGLSLRDVPHALTDLDVVLGGCSIDDVMSAGEVRPVRLLLIDGAESVLEGKGQIFRVIAGAALRAGFGVVAVTRADGFRQVHDELARAMEVVAAEGAPREHIVRPLSKDESEVIATTFGLLARLRSDPRAGWLLARPGLVDALLRSGSDPSPGELLCEADVYAAVWQSLIRRNEIHAPKTSSPDDREHLALNTAKRTLGITTDTVAGSAAAELRSDGFLRAPNNPALSSGDEFATDLFRDFALSRLFLKDGWAALTDAGGPRWAIRAARLGCQAELLNPNRIQAWSALSASFAQIAAQEGDRWSEVPYEALLTVGNANTAISELWEPLTADDNTGLMTLLRLAEVRYVSGTIGDPFALAPLVKVAFCDRPKVDHGKYFGHRTITQMIQELVLAWLRGMANTDPRPDALRQQVRETILDSNPPLHDDFTIEALASLGPDIDARADAWLRKVAEESPSHLNPAVESLVVAVSMSQAKPKLLLDLAEAYYIEQPDPNNPWGGRSLHDDGIRDFKHGLGFGFGHPGAAWYYGPFYRLLAATPADGIAFINRMLDHAAKYRVDKSSRWAHTSPEPAESDGITLDLFNLEARRYVGDGHVWAWYRGSSVGPYACMSALLALEQFADRLLEKMHVPARTIVDLFLHDCHNLAVLGLLVGFLIRHPDEAEDLLDPFLAQPDIWHLEISRVAGGHFSVRDPDADKLTGRDRRDLTPHQVVGGMVVNARVRGDEKRLAQLEKVGNLLSATAKAAHEAVDGDDQYLAMIEGWAAEFRIDNYNASRTTDGIAIEFQRPPEVERVLAPGNDELQIVNMLYGLQNRYSRYNDAPDNWPTEHLVQDLAIARRLDEEDSIPADFRWPENPLVAIAAAAVRAQATGRAEIDTSDLIWAADALMWAAEHPQIDEFSLSGSMFMMGADRAAAASAPLLLLEPFDQIGLDRARLGDCLRSLATSVYDEVRALYVQGCQPVWTADCDVDAATGACRRHKPAWAAAVAGLEDSRLGPWNQDAQRQVPGKLVSPYHESLPAVADDDLLLNRLRMPLACMIDAREVPCIRDAVNDLWTPLWDAHRRSLAHWWKEGYDHQAHITHEPIAHRMVKIALEGDDGLVRSHIESFAADSGALQHLFDGFATVFTYDDELRERISDFWPWALQAALDAIGDGRELRGQHHWFDYMTAALLPTPNPRSSDPDIDGTLARCRANWLQPNALDGIADRWLDLARWEPKAADAVIKFAKGVPLDWQTSIALTWIETIIGGRYDLIANHLWYLEDWMTQVRQSEAVRGEAKPQYHRIIDGLAAAGDRVAVRLQQLDE